MSDVQVNVSLQAQVKRAYDAFFTPSQYKVSPDEAAILEGGDTRHIPSETGQLALTTWGTGDKTALLMHGWGGARAHMTRLVAPLLEAGFRVVAFDQPAHGSSDGSMTNAFEQSAALEQVTAQEGRFDAIIAHSFGTLIASYGLTQRNIPAPERLVYLGSLNRLMDTLPRFQQLAHLPDIIIHGLCDLFYANFGQAVLDSVVNQHFVQRLTTPLLMFHDVTDPITPIEDSRAIAAASPNARLVETEGLGHRGALQSEEIHGQIIAFLQA